jgi:hypothetical protein
MKALSIRQPWAWLIVQGIKDIENRTWPTEFRGRFLVHASRRVDVASMDLVREACLAEGIELPAELLTGGVVGEAVILDCVTSSESEWFEGPYGFVIGRARELPFRACSGRLKFFNVHYPSRRT